MLQDIPQIPRFWSSQVIVIIGQWRDQNFLRAQGVVTPSPVCMKLPRETCFQKAIKMLHAIRLLLRMPSCFGANPRLNKKYKSKIIEIFIYYLNFIFIKIYTIYLLYIYIITKIDIIDIILYILKYVLKKYFKILIS